MKNKLKKLSISLTVAALTLMTAAQATGGLATSTLGVGVKKLLNDASTFLVILSPIAGGVAAVYFLIRKGMADEQDGKMWTKRIVVAIGCGVGGMLVGGIITLLSGYFS